MAHEITNEQIEALRVEAALSGDMDQADLCTAALGGDAAARAACARAIDDARADRLTRAADHVSATEIGEGLWAHYDDTTSRYYVIGEDDLASLCDYLDDDDPQVSGDAYSHWCAGCTSREMPVGWEPGCDLDATRTYTVYDSDPAAGSSSTWPDHEDAEAEGDSLAEALDYVREQVESEAAGLSTADGYEVGQRIYALVRDLDGTVTTLSYELTADDLGVDDEEVAS